ncbi:MAG: flagellar protein FlgN [Lachnospiraceae bacterium]|nr:flagellar protein FlgN [Lachnospiraceae bacterium]
MASLVEELLGILETEKKGYDQLFDLSVSKREAIVNRDLQKLESTAEKEQLIADSLKNLENKRVRVLKDMAVVLGKDGENLTVTQVIDMLKKQPEEQKALTKARDVLVESASKMQFMNNQNEVLLKQALELVEFDLTLFKSLKQAPETANYDRNAYNTGDLLPSGGFDAKQ